MPDDAEDRQSRGARLYKLVEDLRRSTIRIAQQAAGKHIVYAHQESELHREWDERFTACLREVVRLIRERDGK
jgi:hypothetical protein